VKVFFFAGGDQWVYYSYWKDTPLLATVNSLITNKHVTVGGTSAGMVIQSQFIFTAQYDTIVSKEALDNPYDRKLTIGYGFINQPYLTNVITDSHFYERDRMGRSVAFVARLEQDRLVTKAARGIACDESTAVLVSQTGIGTVVSNGGVAYFLYATKFPTVCREGEPLQFSDLEVRALNNGDQFDLVSWSSNNGRKYSISASGGSLSSEGNNGQIY